MTPFSFQRDRFPVRFHVSVVQWHPFSLFFLVPAPLNWSSAKRVPFFPRVTEQLRCEKGGRASPSDRPNDVEDHRPQPAEPSPRQQKPPAVPGRQGHTPNGGDGCRVRQVIVCGNPKKRGLFLV